MLHSRAAACMRWCLLCRGSAFGLLLPFERALFLVRLGFITLCCLPSACLAQHAQAVAAACSAWARICMQTLQVLYSA
jgi:hypothetical protein